MSNRFSDIRTFDEDFDFDEPIPATMTRAQEAPLPQVDATNAPIALQEIPQEVKNKKPVSVHEIGAGEITPAKQKILDAKIQLHKQMLEEFNLIALEELPRDQLVNEVRKFVADYVAKERLPLNNQELEAFVGTVVDEMTGLGPLEPLMRNDDISDILINGPNNCFAEINGILQPITIPFKDEAHLVRIIGKIVAGVGRRIDESNPMCDARMPDGSRFNAAIRPITIDGPLVSIRKFKEDKLTLEKLVGFNALAPQMAEVMQHAVSARMTTIISGGTGTGKTTMLNALSAFINPKERVLTIEDAAELTLQIPHVGRMETQRDLVKNALRMRPDRVILGEVRGEECFDMLQAMNTGHEGSMATIHSNTCRDAIGRMEQMLGMTGMPMTVSSIRSQISSAVHLIVQLTRLSDGQRKVTSISEITGMEGDIIQMQEIFRYKRTGMTAEHKILGHFEATGVRPRFLEELEAMGIELDSEIFEPGIELS